jgi:hypothetical protein
MAEDKNPLTEVDPIFTDGHASHEEHKTEEDPLKGFDPIFNEPSNAHSSELTNEEAARLANAHEKDHIGEVIGGFTGAVIGSGVPKYVPPQTATAQKNVAGQRAAYQAAQEMLGHQQGQRVQTVADIINQHQVAQAELNLAREELERAHQYAKTLGVSPEVEGLFAGDKWSQKVVADMGPGGEGVTEAARNYRLQQSLSPEEAAKFKASRSGLFVPNQIETTGPFYNEEQKLAQRHLTRTQTAHKEAVQNAARAESAMHKHTGPTATKPNELRQAETVAEKSRVGLSKAEAELAELNKAKSFLSKIPYFNTIMGGLSGAELVHAYDAFQRGETLEGVMAGMGGVGGLLSLVPHPATKAVGTAMTIPPLMYEGYKALR